MSRPRSFSGRFFDEQLNLTFEDRVKALRLRVRLIFQVCIGASLALMFASDVLGHQQAFFAPIAAVIAIIAGNGGRRRTAIELMVGVSVGILVGELLVTVIGRGTWQIGLVIALAMIIASLLGLKGIAFTQATTSAILLVAVLPTAAVTDPAITRFLDASVGGAIGLAMTILIPRNPVRDIDRDVQATLRSLAQVLSKTAEALRRQDPAMADVALMDARAMQPSIEAMIATTTNAREIARLAPLRWKQRDHVELYFGSIRRIDYAARDSRMLARKVAAMLRHGERPPASMDIAIEALAKAVRIFADGLAGQDDFAEAQRKLVAAARIATLALPEAASLDSAATVSQVRSLAADLLYASGFTRDEVDEWLDFD